MNRVLGILAIIAAAYFLWPEPKQPPKTIEQRREERQKALRMAAEETIAEIQQANSGRELIFTSCDDPKVPCAEDFGA